MTPTVQSVSPTVGQAGTIITITGTNFSSSPTENSVYIGGMICPILEANETFITCTAGPNVAGTYDVNVLVASSGFSIIDGNATFEYTLTIDRLYNSTSGSIGGGTLITILGMGFPTVPERDILDIVNEFAVMQFINEPEASNYSTNDFTVFLNDSACAVVKSNYSYITCISGPHPAASVDVTVNVNDITVILENAFKYSTESTPIVTKIMPMKLPVHSYSMITIKGLGFGNLGSGAGSGLRAMLLNDTSEIKVIINGMICEIEQYSDVMIVCTAPPQGPSTYPVFVLVEGAGFAVQAMAFNSEDAFLYPPVFYELQVFGAFPSIGSVLGGSLLTIYGTGFSSMPYEVEVDIGNLPCEIKSTNSTHISCKTTAITKTVTVEPDIVGSTLVWDPEIVVIQIGDTVQWSWVGLSLDLFQVANGSSVYDGQGFRSERITNGNFSYTFTQAGTYYYASNLDNFVQLRGTVIVEELINITSPISVKVNNYFAEYYITDNQTVSNSSTCQGAFFPEVVTFTYATCATPVVTGITPLNSTVQDEITISGQGFSTTPTMNRVTIGDNYTCNVINSNETSISCLLDPNSMLPIDKQLPIIVIVVVIYIPGYDAPSNGIALNDMTAADQSIVFYPIITNLTPTDGSFQGGLDLYITGSGFGTDTVVSIGGSNCVVNSLNYSNIICTVPAFDGDMTMNEYLAAIVVTTSEVNARCGLSQCAFTYSGSNTPIIDDISPRSFFGDTTSIGLLFNDTLPPLPVNITIGMYPCENIDVSDETASISCTFNPIEAGSYTVRVVTPVGEAMFSNSPVVESEARVTSLTPSTGSAEGGNTITISGYGFSSQISNNNVLIGNKPCQIMYSNYTTIRCVVPPGSMNTNATVAVVTNNINLPDVYYYYGGSPQVSAIYPTSGQAGDNVTITGSLFSDATSDNIVTIGGAICNVYSANELEINCTLGVALAGTYRITLLVDNIGKAAGSVTFTYILRVSELSPMQGSFAGKNILTIYGAGFEPATTFVKICDQSCIPTNDPPSLTTLQCEIPAFSYAGSDMICNVTVSSMSSTVTITNGYTYVYNLTPQVTSLYPAMGGTAGGTTITIIGSGFTSSNTTVSIGDSNNQCNISDINGTTIVCQTGAFGRTMRAEVLVNVNGNFAESGGLTFFYVDLWNSTFTWGGQPPPVEGDFVVVPRGQTLAIDVDTPILSFLLIQGGSVMFLDEGDVSLHTQFVLITDNGSMQVGTEEEPFMHKAEIVLYGHVLSTELPIYGAKTLAVRHGTLDLHGKKLNVTWTRLDATANPGDTTITLREPVPWEIGGKIVIASTSYSQRENEEVEITGIDSTGTMLTIDPPLQYKHISVKQTIAGKFIDTSAEVGYLTRNVVFRGNRITEWDAPIPACPEEFRPGQFDVQTCFQGRFGAETASDQFGGQIMLHAAVMNENRVTGRIEYVEVTHAGQAFRLGRYPIHFHLNGDVTGSYVRGCGIHHTFNRAVTVHGVNNLLVENNVAYNIMGHAYFLEDGVEIGTIIQDNLGVFVRGSSSLLNVDVTPATFWVVNPNNIVRRNAAAGGSHFGFWYRLERFPSGPSFTTSICPQNVPLGEFTDNSAHSMGWYGLWVFQAYFPKVNGACSGGVDEPAIFNNLLAWKNNRGVEFHETVGALQVHNSTMLDNEEAGVEITAITGQWGGAVVKDVLIVGHSDVNSDDSDFCTVSGFRAPHSYYLSVSNVTFVNFDRPGCSAVLACSHCRALQGGYLTRYSDITLIDSPNLSGWQWTYEHVHRDLDGSLTGIVNGSLVPYTGLLPSDRCSMHPSSSTSVDGSLCDASVDFVRIAVHSVLPTSIATRTLILTNQFGSSNVNYVITRLTGPSGYMAIIPKGYEHFTRWDNGGHLSNISYSLIVSGLEEDEYFWISRNYSQPVDGVVINGVEQNSSSTFPDPAIHNTGTWYFNNSTNDVTYLVKGQPNGAQFNINFRTFRCFYPNCIVPTPPPTQEPGAQNMTRWSDNSTWENGRFPQEGESVIINNTQHVMVDVPIPRLASITILGTLELLDELNHTVEADYILINGGTLIAGSPEKPFENMATFVLHGNQLSPEVILPPRGPVLGAKALGVFGKLILHGQERSVIWTHLAETAPIGSDTIEVIGTPDWNVGDEIIIASTSFEMLHTEKFQILSISEGTITLNGTLQYKHLGEETTVDGHKYIQRAEVGLLTRNIKIQSGNLATTDEESFGCRILVGSYLNAFGDRLVGSAQIDGVEIAYCGQEGYPDSFDPRYSFAVVNTRIGANEITYIRRSSIHDGYNSGIGAFGSDGVIISDNVIHRTVGPSVVLEGSDHILIKTMATVALFPGTYRGINDPQNFKWTANFKLISTTNLTLSGNAAAGGGKVGFHVDGEPCDSLVANGTPRWDANVAHSTLHGIHVGYDDGLDTCLQLSHFTIYSCYHYGIFTYSRSGVYMENNVLVDNNAALLLNVFSPPALSHQTSTKTVMIKNTVIVGASPYLTAEDDVIVPEVSSHAKSFSPMLSPDDGHIGIILSSFLSGRGHFPKSPWPSITSYPAISGLTTLDGVTFINFVNRDTKRDFAFVSNPISEDCQHPTYVSNAKLINVDNDLLYYNRMPKLSSVNPSDCVDLDCDAQKHILIKDVDGSLLNHGADGSIISQAEFQWGGDPRRGLGDFRVPTVLKADPSDGTPIPVDDLFPLKGIVRGGNRTESNCSWISSWNAYSCTGLDHLMFIFESLDGDTEVRRLSPFALAANGFIDILNGPQDHGWCGGYTCQERISTFYGIIAPGLNYEIALSSTNPQNMRFHLLNAEESDTIRIAFIYTNPQRLDVYYGDTYVTPTNVRIENGETVYDSKDPSLPFDQFQPTINDQPGANFYERSVKRLYFILRGNTPITIRTAPVVQLSLNLAPVTVDEFFEENLVFNLATLLGIDQSRIRIVNVISEASNRKRQAVGMSVDIEIGNPPPISNGTVGNDTATNQTTVNSTIELDFNELENITSMVAEAIQTGQLDDTLNITVISADIQPPEPPPVDFTGGVRATNTTGGPQPGDVDNDTLTYEQEQNAQRPPEVTPVTLTIPTELRIISQPVGGIEGLSFTPLPILAVYDRGGEIVANLGIGDPWVVSIILMSNSASSVQVLPSSQIVFTGGYANLTNFSISHPGNGYILMFNITDPPVGFTAQTAPFDVATRELVINIVDLPESGNTTLPLYPYPTVELLDKGILERVGNLGWRGRRWFARLQVYRSNQVVMDRNAEFDANNASAIFTNVLISQPGQYLMEFTAYTSPQSEVIVMRATKTISIRRLPSAMMRFVLNVDFDSVIGSNQLQELFIQSITSRLSDILPQVTIYNVSLSRGSIVVTFNVQSENEQDVRDAVDTFIDTDFSIMYNGSTLMATNRTAEFTGATNEDDDDDTHTTVIIIACACGGSLLLLFLIILLCGISWWCRSKRHTKVWRVHVKPGTSTHDNTKHYEIRDIYWQVSQSHIEENEYVSGPVVRDFNTNEPVNEESSLTNDAVALTNDSTTFQD